MRVKVPPIRGDVTPNLPTPSRLGILQSEAGNRTQPDTKQISDTGVKRETIRVNQVLEKCLSSKPQSEQQMRTSSPPILANL